MQLVYIALVTPGGTVSADVRAVSYIGIPLAMVAIKSQGLALTSADAANLAKSMGTLVGTVGTVLFYGTATLAASAEVSANPCDLIATIASGIPM